MKRQETHSTLAEDLRSLQNLARSVLAEKARDVPLKPSEAIWSQVAGSVKQAGKIMACHSWKWHDGMTIFLVTDELLLTPSGRYRSWTTLDWSKELKGTSTGNPYQWCSKPWLPVDIPSNQSIDYDYAEIGPQGVCYSSDQILPLKSFEEQRTSMTLSTKILRTLSVSSGLIQVRNSRMLEILQFDGCTPLFICHIGEKTLLIS